MKTKAKSQILAVHSVFPDNYVRQQAVAAALKEKWKSYEHTNKIIDRLNRSSLVEKRHISMPMEQYTKDCSFEERNRVFIDVSCELAELCINEILAKADISPKAISEIIFTTVTGIAVPSIDARLMNRIAFAPNLKRVPLFGLGCVAGAAGLARAADYLTGHEDEYAILLAIELCSLTFQNSDRSMANMVASSLFGDGAAAVLLGGRKKINSSLSMPKIIDSRSFFFNDTEDVMGWDVTNNGFKIVLNADVPKIAFEKIPACVDEILNAHFISRNDVAAWIAHPGGPKVIKALTEGLGLSSNALKKSYESLFDYGNISSASVILILQKTIEENQFRPGDYGVLLAMGPGFCAEVVLLQW